MCANSAGPLPQPAPGSNAQRTIAPSASASEPTITSHARRMPRRRLAGVDGRSGIAFLGRSDLAQALHRQVPLSGYAEHVDGDGVTEHVLCRTEEIAGVEQGREVPIEAVVKLEQRGD